MTVIAGASGSAAAGAEARPRVRTRGGAPSTVGRTSISPTSNAIPAVCPMGASRGRRRTGMCAVEPQGWFLGVLREAPVGRAVGIAAALRQILVRATRATGATRATRAIRATLALAVLAVMAVPAAAHAELYYLIVGGLGGEPKYQEQFDKEVQQLAAVARRTTGDARVQVLSGEAATREALEKTLASLQKKAKATDSLAVVLVGHGSYDGESYKLNLPGPDIDGAELLELLAAVPARTQLVVNATSASGATLEQWAGNGRTLITATRSGFERNATRFADYWAKALADGSADINKNGVITAQEAFDYASREVADSFKKSGTLATEHPQIKGDGAARFMVARLQSAPLPATPELATLDKQKADIEDKIETLRQKREQLANDDYLNQLQALLVQLAEVQGKIDGAQKE